MAPPSPPDVIPVIAAVIERDGRFLVGRRPRNKRHGGLWEFPGGKVEKGESWAAAAARELHEELGLRLRTLGQILFEQVDPGSPFRIHFIEVVAEGEPRPLEHIDLGWFALDALRRLALAPSDARFVEAMQRNLLHPSSPD